VTARILALLVATASAVLLAAPGQDPKTDVAKNDIVAVGVTCGA
jgi:hypothetical protein